LSDPEHLKQAKILCTSMSLQRLYDFPTLQVPDEDLPVLTSTDDVLAACCDEGRGKTIRPVYMPSISLLASRCVVVPQADSRVLG
jgi:hypothetical protein